MNPHQVTVDFETALCEYTGAPYAVAVNSCTMALLLATRWHILQGTNRDQMNTAIPSVEIPKRTYCSVPMIIRHAGAKPMFRDEEWLGSYQLAPLPVWDCAREFTSGMYLDHDHQTAVEPGTMLCVSFHASKILGLEQGGAILHDDPEADEWLRKARFDGRTQGVAPKDDKNIILGWHCYMNPSTAAQGILKLHSLSRHNDPLPNDNYPDLSTLEAFR